MPISKLYPAWEHYLTFHTFADEWNFGIFFVHENMINSNFEFHFERKINFLHNEVFGDSRGDYVKGRKCV